MIENKIKIAIGSDHAGYKLKGYLIKILEKRKDIELKDYGTFNEEAVDYPDIAHQLTQSIVNKNYEIGILLCGSGNGVNMVANKYPSVRAALCWNKEIARLARLHNNANVLSIPARFIDNHTAFEIVEVFLKTEFEGGRHQRRINKI